MQYFLLLRKKINITMTKCQLMLALLTLLTQLLITTIESVISENDIVYPVCDRTIDCKE